MNKIENKKNVTKIITRDLKEVELIEKNRKINLILLFIVFVLFITAMYFIEIS